MVIDLDPFDSPDEKNLNLENQAAQNTPSTYIVKKGENLNAVADATGLSVSEILLANPGLLKERIPKGTQIKLPPAN